MEEEGGDGDGDAEEDREQQHAAHVDHQELVNVQLQVHHFESVRFVSQFSMKILFPILVINWFWKLDGDD